MDEARSRIQEAPNQAQCRAMRLSVMTLAQQSAIKAVKRQFQAQGVKLQRVGDVLGEICRATPISSSVLPL